MVSNEEIFGEVNTANARTGWISGNMMTSGVQDWAQRGDYTSTRAGYLNNISSASKIMPSGANIRIGTTYYRVTGWTDWNTTGTISGTIYPWSFSASARFELNYSNTGIPSGAAIRKVTMYTGSIHGDHEPDNRSHTKQGVFAPIALSSIGNYDTGSETVWESIWSETNGASEYEGRKVYSKVVRDYTRASVYDGTNLCFSGLPWTFVTRGKATTYTDWGAWNWQTESADHAPSELGDLTNFACEMLIKLEYEM